VRIGRRHEPTLFLSGQVFAASFDSEQFASHLFTFTAIRGDWQGCRNRPDGG
jgi:hypothetical protein